MWNENTQIRQINMEISGRHRHMLTWVKGACIVSVWVWLICNWTWGVLETHQPLGWNNLCLWMIIATYMARDLWPPPRRYK